MGFWSGREIAVGRIIWHLLLVGVSFASGYFVQPLVSGNNEAINTVVTIFSILAGFLIAVITFIGDPTGQSWQKLQLEKSEVKARLRRHRTLFYMYLVTLGLALAMFVVPDEFVGIKKIMEQLFVGVATFVFLASFALPRSLTDLQLDRYEAVRSRELPKYLQDLETQNNSSEERKTK